MTTRSWLTPLASRAMRAALALSLAAGLAGFTMGSAGAYDSTPALPIPNGSNPRTDGYTVVYQARIEHSHWDVDGATIADRIQFPIAIGESQAMTPDIDGGTIVWTETGPGGDFDIRARRLEDPSVVTVAGSDQNEFYPAIFGPWVAWVSAPQEVTSSSIQKLQVRSLGSSDAPRTIDQVAIGPGSGGILRPVISGKRLAWARLEQTTPHSVHWQIRTQMLADTEPTVVAEGNLNVSGPGAEMGIANTPGYDLNGNILVYAADLTLTQVDLVSDQRTVIAGPKTGDWKPAQNPTTDGRFVFWQDYRASGNLQSLAEGIRNGTLHADIFGYDLLTGSEFPVTTNTGYNANPYARGGALTYSRQPALMGDEPEIHAARLDQVLPTAPRPATGDPRDAYFPETGHLLASAFSGFWARSGGLPVFGYPLTEAFTEHGNAVQFVERQRLEHHPEKSGTPYEVELGLLGVEDAAKRDLLGTAPFQPLTKEDQTGVPCEYFAATGHFVCATFLNYWQTHGLDFGDPGISFRESLALFGYPISEPYTDPVTGLTVQYFERARFEFHGKNPEPYKILLGRIGADVLMQRDW